MDFATYAKKIHETLTAGSVKFICRAIAALVAAGKANDFLKSLAGQMEKRPLSNAQIDAAKKALLGAYVGTLARLALDASKSATAPTTPAAAPPATPAAPKALGPRKPRKPKAPKLPKLPKPVQPPMESTGPLHTPDKGGMSPWEYDDRHAA